jgi:Na+/proline symporter
MLATSLSKDLYRRFLDPGASDARLLFVARIAAMSGAAVAVGLAVISPSVVDALKIFYGLVAACLFVPVIVALYSGKAGAPEALASIAAGIVVTALGVEIGPLTPNFLGLIAAGLGFGLVAVGRGLGRRRTSERSGSG